MKNNKLYIILFAAILLITSCTKDDEYDLRESVYIEDVEYRGLPQYSEWGYNTLLEMGAPPQQARSVLPNSLKTKLKIKANVREWLHIFKLRAVNPGAHPQIREVMIPALKECAEKWPVLFENLMKELSNERV